MGFIKAFTGALSGTFADQWKEFYVPRAGVPGTAAIFEATLQSQNNGKGENTKGYNNIISNGSKIVVPEGTALVTLQDGSITGFIAEAGGYEFRSNDPNSQSIFAGDGIVSPLIKSTWEKVKFGGQPGAQQLAFYVNLKEIAGNKFGTPENIYWNDSYLEVKAGGMARGTYSLKITDPLLFIKNYVPSKYLQPGAPIFDFADMDNEAANQLFDEFITTISSAVAKFSHQAKDHDMDTMDYIQEEQAKFATTMDEEVENTYQWSTDRGLKVEKVNILINYDEKTQAVLDDVRQDDIEIRKERKHIDRVETRRGEAFSENMAGMMAASTGRAMENASANENGAMMGFMGMGMAQQQGANILGTVGNMPQQQPAAPAEDPTEKLLNAKKLLDAGAITQEDYDKLKAQILGI